MFRVVSCVIRRGCFLWPMCSLGKTARLCLASFCTPRPNLSVIFIFSCHHSSSGSTETSPERLITLQITSWLLRWRYIYQIQDILMGSWTSVSFISILHLCCSYVIGISYSVFITSFAHMLGCFLLKSLPYTLVILIHLYFIYPYLNLDFMLNSTRCPSQVNLSWLGFLWYEFSIIQAVQ